MIVKAESVQIPLLSILGISIVVDITATLCMRHFAKQRKASEPNAKKSVSKVIHSTIGLIALLSFIFIEGWLLYSFITDEEYVICEKVKLLCYTAMAFWTLSFILGSISGHKK
ncbi:hypothetical protein ADUPG1_007988 [Aduncisulcus paluster]|uniref:Uncharacterized protein n=1 Tax=Aduncisulcus paluster TaxID=2918883 RepID=A0ABQ5KTF9_9EUKA|nr:hypothetical protein ADUPG1_007988 [Aduncisulcus paluster]